jgi:hypothetical protein
MKYLKTLNIWDQSIASAIMSNQIKLQRGQWLLCGSGKLSRYVSHTKHSINAIHWQGSSKATNKKFKIASKLVKLQEQFRADLISKDQYFKQQRLLNS